MHRTRYSVGLEFSFFFLFCFGHSRTPSKQTFAKDRTDIGFKVANVLEGKLWCAGVYMLV